MKYLAIIIIVCIASVQSPAQETEMADALRKGVELYDEGNWEEALATFESIAASEPANNFALFNSLTLQAITRKFDKAAATLEKDPQLTALNAVQRGDALYNLGTSYLNIAKAQDEAGQLMQAARELEQAAQLLRQSLISNPGNYSAKNNLEIANKLLEKLQQQQQQQSEGENDQGKNSEEGNEDQQSEEERNEENRNEQKNEEQQQDQKQNQQQDNQQQQKQQRSISPETAKNLLEAAREKEKQALQAIRAMLAKQKKNKSGKDY